MRPVLVALAAAAALLAACVPPPVGQQLPPQDARRLDDVTSAPTPTVSAEDDAAAAKRRARAAALRLRITGPQVYGAGAGSGFAIDDHTVVTNAHVVGTGTEVAMTSWDGHDLGATFTDLSVRHDLALLAADEPVPVEPLTLADADPAEDDAVMVVGFPGGGRITVQDDAKVVDVVDGSEYSELFGDVLPARIVRLHATSVRPGSSGGPVLNSSGAVVGVVFAYEQRRNGYALAIAVSTLRDWLDDR